MRRRESVVAVLWFCCVFLRDKCTYAVPCPALPSFSKNYCACFPRSCDRPIHFLFCKQYQKAGSLPFQFSQLFCWRPVCPDLKAVHPSVTGDCKRQHSSHLS